MKSLCLLVLLFYTVVVSGQMQISDFPDTTELHSWAGFSGVHYSLVRSDSVVATWENGMLNGEYTSYYSNGRIKAKGQYKNNLRTGKWVLYAEKGNGKVVIDFNRYGYVTLHRARIPGRGGVRWGCGRIAYRVPDFSNGWLPEAPDTAAVFCDGLVRFKHGVKNGAAHEWYSNGKLRSEATFKNGLYHGKRIMYFAGGQKQLECEYSNGAPTGTRFEYFPDGTLMSAKQKGPTDGSASSFYLDKLDVFMSSRKMLYTDTLFGATRLFFHPDSAAPLFEVLNKAFFEGTLSAYQDDELREIYFPFHNKPDLSGLEAEGGNYRNLRGLVIKTDEIFNTQTWLMYKFPMAIQPVSSFPDSDTLAFHGGPWLYFPQLRNEIPESDYHFSYFKSFSYPYIVATSYSYTPWIMNYADTAQISSEHLRSSELEHDLWLVFYGINKDWKGF